MFTLCPCCWQGVPLLNRPSSLAHIAYTKPRNMVGKLLWGYLMELPSSMLEPEALKEAPFLDLVHMSWDRLVVSIEDRCQRQCQGCTSRHAPNICTNSNLSMRFPMENDTLWHFYLPRAWAYSYWMQWQTAGELQGGLDTFHNTVSEQHTLTFET